jgi:hypothetical protein
MGLYEILGAGAGVVLIDLVIRVVALIIIPRDRLPTAAMAWLLAVFFIPVIGVLLFLLIGNPKLPERRRRKQQEMDAIIARESETLMPPSPQDSWPAWLPPVVTLTRNLTAMPLVGGNDARLRPERLHGDGDDQCQHEGSDEAGGAAQTGHHDHGAGAPQRSTTARGNPRSADGDSATWTISALPSQGLTQGLVRYGRGHSAMAGSPDTGEASRVRSDTMYVKGA